MKGLKKRKFKCVGCGLNRPCFLETNQEQHNYFLDDEDLFIEDLKCVLDSTNQTSYDWKEVKFQSKKIAEQKEKIDQLTEVIERNEKYEQLQISTVLFKEKNKLENEIDKLRTENKALNGIITNLETIVLLVKGKNKIKWRKNIS